MHLKVENICWSIDKKEILKNISLDVKPKEIVGLLGPNGSGKSSLLKTIYRINKPTSGVITLNEKDVWKISAKELAQQMAVMMQESLVDFSFSVREIVMMGRLPFKTGFSKYSTREYELMENALVNVDATHLIDRDFYSLSGGEKQRILLARALVQEPTILILDEPTNHLDIHFQLEILEIVKNLNLTCLMAIHDLNLACRYCDKLYVLNKGHVVASGTPQFTCTEDTIRNNYFVEPVIYFNDQFNAMELQFYKMLH